MGSSLCPVPCKFNKSFLLFFLQTRFSLDIMIYCFVAANEPYGSRWFFKTLSNPTRIISFKVVWEDPSKLHFLDFFFFYIMAMPRLTFRLTINRLIPLITAFLKDIVVISHLFLKPSTFICENNISYSFSKFGHGSLSLYDRWRIFKKKNRFTYSNVL